MKGSTISRLVKSALFISGMECSRTTKRIFSLRVVAACFLLIVHKMVDTQKQPNILFRAIAARENLFYHALPTNYQT